MLIWPEDDAFPRKKKKNNNKHCLLKEIKSAAAEGWKMRERKRERNAGREESEKMKERGRQINEKTHER